MKSGRQPAQTQASTGYFICLDKKKDAAMIRDWDFFNWLTYLLEIRRGENNGDYYR
ncbi:MAG: hypothetical protein JRD87_18240 [Deltaproteobacteria bacterium]|nr:hypothetical protein [Deltaproteobacteria bacterium]